MRATRPEPVPLGPGSLTWRWFGDVRLIPGIQAVGILENLHPELGAGVEHHSDVFVRPYDRLFRSIGPIYGTAYDGPTARETALAIRGYHRGINGTDARGRRYNALHPWTFYWAHATFFNGIIRGAEFAGQPLSEDAKRQLHAEHVQWYELYGMPMDVVPPTWDEWQEYWGHTLDDVLEWTPAAQSLLDDAPDKLPWDFIPQSLWRTAGWPARGGLRWLTIGLMPPQARELLDVGWSRADELALRAIGRALAPTWPLLPGPLRYHPRAWAGFRREAAAARESEKRSVPSSMAA